MTTLPPEAYYDDAVIAQMTLTLLEFMPPSFSTSAAKIICTEIYDRNIRTQLHHHRLIGSMKSDIPTTATGASHGDTDTDCPES